MFISFNQEILTGIKWPTRWWNSATKVSLSVVFFYVMQNQSSVIFFGVLVSCQSVSELHRPDRVSLHVALLLSAHLLWRNAHHRQCDHSQRHGCHWQDCWQGAHTNTNQEQSFSAGFGRCYSTKNAQFSEYYYIKFSEGWGSSSTDNKSKGLNDSLSCSAHLAAVPPPERWPHRRGSLLLASAVAVGRLPGCVHLCGQESGIVGRDCSRSCDGHSGIACRERCESLQQRLNSVFEAALTFSSAVRREWRTPTSPSDEPQYENHHVPNGFT